MKLSNIGHMIQCNQMTTVYQRDMILDSKVHGANMGPIWGRKDPGGPHVGSMNFGIWDHSIRIIFIISSMRLFFTNFRNMISNILA